jgi:hypothetical protein
VYFGYPHAHEDEAQRAVQASLELVEAMAPLNIRLEPQYGMRVAVRIGLHAGLVVMGEMGHGNRQEQRAMGDTPNIAAQLQEDTQHYALTGTLTAVTIPATLQDSLMARLDRLGTAKDVAQLGAVVRREFAYTVLQAITPLDVGGMAAWDPPCAWESLGGSFLVTHSEMGRSRCYHEDSLISRVELLTNRLKLDFAR